MAIFRGPVPVHIHQGGTLRTYCGLGVSRATGGLVAWEQADDATCVRCLDAWLPVGNDIAAHGSAVPL
jgi:hypothetical protein